MLLQTTKFRELLVILELFSVMTSSDIFFNKPSRTEHKKNASHLDSQYSSRLSKIAVATAIKSTSADLCTLLPSLPYSIPSQAHARIPRIPHRDHGVVE